jgi:hypothetical protein
MRTNEQKPFELYEIEMPYDGVKAYKVLFARMAIPASNEPPAEWASKGAVRRAFGRAVVLDPEKVDLRIYPFYELIHRSWKPGTTNFVRLGPNLGTTVKEFIYDGGGPELKGLSDFDAQRGQCVHDELARCFFACNTLQTGFVRSNGFVIAPQPGQQPPSPQLIRKPDGACGLREREYVALGPTIRTRRVKEGNEETQGCVSCNSSVINVKKSFPTWQFAALLCWRLAVPKFLQAFHTVTTT